MNNEQIALEETKPKEKRKEKKPSSRSLFKAINGLIQLTKQLEDSKMFAGTLEAASYKYHFFQKTIGKCIIDV